jgi:hypothetical protein
MLASFVGSLLVDQAGQAWSPQANVAGSRLALLLAQAITPKTMEWLMSGRLTIQHLGSSVWRSTYRSLPDQRAFAFEIEDPTGVGSLTNDPSTVHFSNANAPNWIDGLPDSFGTQLMGYLQGESIQPTIDDTHQLLVTASMNCRTRIDNQYGGMMATHQLLGSYIGEQIRHGTDYDIRAILHRVLTSSVMCTENVRASTRTDFSVEYVQQPVNFMTGSSLAMHLFRLKNAPSMESSAFSRAQSTFSRLTGKSFDVGLTGLIETPPPQASPVPPIELEVKIRDETGEFRLDERGAGVKKALYLSAVLATDNGGVLLLDEPASNLHPHMQTVLASEIAEERENQIFVVTHSANLIRPTCIANTSRFHMKSGETKRWGFSSSTLQQKERSAIQQELRRSTDFGALLFADAVILVGGATELGALPVWYEKKFGEPLASRNVAMYQVGGDEGNRRMVRFLEMFGVPRAIVCDGKAIGDKGGCSIVKQLERAGASTPKIPSTREYRERRSLLEKYGVFTIADSAADGLEAFESLPPFGTYGRKARSEVGDSKPRIAQRVAELAECPPEVGTLFCGIRKWLGIAGRR